MSIISELMEEAESSQHHESFKTIHNTKKTRIGAGLRATEPPVFFIEVNIRTCTSEPVDPQEIIKLGETLVALESSGYMLSCEDNSFYAVKNTGQDLLVSELESTIILCAS